MDDIVDAPARRLARWGMAGVGGATIVYVAGFLSWSVHAADQNLGLLPLARTQYVAAGATLVVMTALAFVFLTFLQWLVAQFDQGQRRPRPQILRLVLHAVLSAVAVLFTGVIVMLTLETLPAFDLREIDIFRMFLITAVVTLVMHPMGWVALLPWASSGAKEGPPAARNRGSAAERTWDYVLVALLFFAVFSGVLLPSMSPVFGGASAREAYFDFDTSELSNETVASLWPGWNGSEPGTVVRTPPVRVLFINSETVFVSPIHDYLMTGTRFEVPRSSVKAIIWIR